MYRKKGLYQTYNAIHHDPSTLSLQETQQRLQKSTLAASCSANDSLRMRDKEGGGGEEEVVVRIHLWKNQKDTFVRTMTHLININLPTREPPSI